MHSFKIKIKRLSKLVNYHKLKVVVKTLILHSKFPEYFTLYQKFKKYPQQF